MLYVVAGILTDSTDRVLICRRLPGKPMAGKWEFPGGKLERGEARIAGLRRELDEELGIAVDRARPLIRFGHDYTSLSVTLDIWRVERFSGEPSGRQGQELAWVEPAELPALDLLEADRPIVTAITLPDRYLVTGPPFDDRRAFVARLDAALGHGIELVQLRVPEEGSGEGRMAFRELAADCLARCRAAGARLLLNGAPQGMADLAGEIGAAGIQVPARYLGALRGMRGSRPGLIGVSCHDAEELAQAGRAGADFAVLGPVNPTASHPDAAPIGWPRFAALVEPVRMPVYAIGGMRSADLPQAWGAGAQGIAAISSLWAER
ncbi:MAG: Nudix family hydrolase [Gammaproteobacteria bacterium]